MKGEDESPVYPRSITNADLSRDLSRLENKMDQLASEMRHKTRNQDTILNDHDERLEYNRARIVESLLALTQFEQKLPERISAAVASGFATRQQQEHLAREQALKDFFSLKRLGSYATAIAAIIAVSLVLLDYASRLFS